MISSINPVSSTINNYSLSTNLADKTLGAEIVSVSDEFFAPADRLLNPDDPKFIPNYYDENGKWMDGWETRRRRSLGHDFCVIKLSFPCLIESVVVDTSYFTGNSPMGVSLDAIYAADDLNLDSDIAWISIVDYYSILSDEKNLITIHNPFIATHVRLNIYPDGGVARLKIFGKVVIKDNVPITNADGHVDLISIANGGEVLACSDMHYGSPINILKPWPGSNMGDGWETRRRRLPGNDWCIFKMYQPGKIIGIELDTTFFKGNFPSEFGIQGLDRSEIGDDKNLLVYQSMFWPEILERTILEANSNKYLEICDLKTYSYIKLNIYPDGGISRFRLWGLTDQCT